MKRCLELAELGRRNAFPNPMVGAVLVYQDRIIGEGFHQQYGGSHAEVNAIRSVKDSDKALISQSTLYVSLEPCSHHGKTPPCSNLIIENRIPIVYVACVDSFSEVSGRGIEKLKEAGVIVELGLLEIEARELNKRFFTFHEKKRPYVILKWAETADGFMDKIRGNEQHGINWITTPETQQLTHQWRSEEMGILIGKNTVINDNPSLTVRASNGSDPIRLIISKSLNELPQESNVLDGQVETIIFNGESNQQTDSLYFVKIDFEENVLEQIMEYLFKKEIQSIIVEGGKATMERFIEQGLWDEARVLKSTQVTFEHGIKAPCLKGFASKQFTFGSDSINIYLNA
ncbi:MAG: bifunctional diaminohydroxyphosphoribosylaminopyrimidine deaminase/5-amino-6-(5-phosphoribosylamino)uracil reductase RibD [Flavobacteriales bacterium]|nr:bifunctional diaminohydroxyphosphoribosylaminopyrimidine deaminase/5-amino-6-(5-phosphoribosylamino)uracil reductase RibD [Flavobacteriales bacterium]